MKKISWNPSRSHHGGKNAFSCLCDISLVPHSLLVVTRLGSGTRVGEVVHSLLSWKATYRGRSYDFIPWFISNRERNVTFYFQIGHCRLFTRFLYMICVFLISRRSPGLWAKMPALVGEQIHHGWNLYSCWLDPDSWRQTSLGGGYCWIPMLKYLRFYLQTSNPGNHRYGSHGPYRPCSSMSFQAKHMTIFLNFP